MPSSSELLSEPVEDNTESDLCSKSIISEPPGSDIGSDGDLTSDSQSELSLVKESNHATVPAVSSELLNESSSSPREMKENQNSLSVPQQLTGAALARRLNVSPSTLRHKKNARNFGKWTSGHDPDGIAWYFDGQKFIVHTATDIQ